MTNRVQRRAVPPLRSPLRSPLGLVLAVVALIGQLALGAMVLPDAAQARQVSALDALSVMCGGVAPAAHQGPAAHRGPAAPRRHHAAEVALCPLSGALAGQAFVVAPEPVVPPPGHGAGSAWRVAHSPRGPPMRAARAGFARGPPILV
jgi:hypothetical protein